MSVGVRVKSLYLIWEGIEPAEITVAATFVSIGDKSFLLGLDSTKINKLVNQRLIFSQIIRLCTT
jgi:hypothetical protein